MKANSVVLDPKIIDSKPYPLRNEVDRFGFSWLVANSIGKQGDPPRALCNWVHGWKWYDIVDHRLLAPANIAIRHKTIVVTNHRQKEELENFGFNSVVVGGLPYAYAYNLMPNVEIKGLPHISKERDTLVLLPKCGYDGGHSLKNFNEVLEYVFTSESLRYRSILCVFGGDLKIREVVEVITKCKIPFITGSDPYSRVDLYRINKIFKNFKYAITNTIGSHIPYLAAHGVRIKLIDPFNERDASSFMLSKTIRDFGSEYINYLEMVNTKDFFLERYGSIISFDKFSDDLTDWGLSEIGYNNILNDENIIKVFGWSMTGKLNAYIETIKYRIDKYF